MCGICGIYNKGGAPVSSGTIVRMREVMVLRGPDDAGIYIGDHIGLGHRRLSIIDLSRAGRQPISNENGRIWAVVNGEIYNFMELREKLVKAGHIFKSKTDSEVIVHGYEEWGEKAFEKIHGMYALAIWDAQREKLILLRDRIGKKPLFYAEIAGSVVFASDIKSIISYKNDFEIDQSAIDCYLAHICVPQSHSIYKGIKKVKPAHYMIFDKGQTSAYRYWSLSFRGKKNVDINEYIEETTEILKTTVKERLICDVPMGAFLSGGVDSSLVVAFMSQLSNQKVKTFSAGFDYQPYNELPYAKKIADLFGTEHHEFILKIDFIDDLLKLVWNYGEPFADSSAVPSYYISKIAKEHIKVALSGDGGDESFAGYDRTQDVYRASLYQKIVPAFISRNILSPFLRMSRGMADKIYLLERIKFYEDYIGEGAKKKYKNYMGFLFQREKLYSREFKEKIGAHDPSHVYEGFYEQADGESDVDKALFVDMNTIMPDDYQVKMDIASMSNSIEIRSPFLDCRVIEFAAKIPSDMKLNWRHSKYFLKKIAERYLPRENIYRPKSGFAVPIGMWFRDELRDYIYAVILSDKAKGRAYFDYAYVRYLLDSHVAGREDHSHRIWSLLWLELWHRMFIDKEITQNNSLKDLI